MEFRNLAQEYRDVISDICHRMGVGMAEFLEKKVGSMKEWDLVRDSPLCEILGQKQKFVQTDIGTDCQLCDRFTSVQLCSTVIMYFNSFWKLHFYEVLPLYTKLLCVLSSVQYCHYVAGLVGIGLSQLFSASKLEDPEVGRDTDLANSMGLFLQKTNIIRDYLEDTQEGRAFWPQEVRWWCELVCFSSVSDLRHSVIVKENAPVYFLVFNPLKLQYLHTFYQKEIVY